VKEGNVSTRDKHRTVLAQVAREATDMFRPGVVTDENREEFEEIALGTRVSEWARWDCEKVLRVFHAALEDSNWASKAAIVQGWLEEEDEEVEL